jgi:hypothetical protein
VQIQRQRLSGKADGMRAASRPHRQLKGGKRWECLPLQHTVARFVKSGERDNRMSGLRYRAQGGVQSIVGGRMLNTSHPTISAHFLMKHRLFFTDKIIPFYLLWRGHSSFALV